MNRAAKDTARAADRLGRLRAQVRDLGGVPAFAGSGVVKSGVGAHRRPVRQMVQRVRKVLLRGGRYG